MLLSRRPLFCQLIRGFSHGQLYDSLNKAPSARTHWHTAGLGFTQVCASPNEPSCTNTLKGQQRLGTGPAGYPVLAHLDLVFRTYAPHDSPFWRIPLRKDLILRGPLTLALQITECGRLSVLPQW